MRTPLLRAALLLLCCACAWQPIGARLSAAEDLPPVVYAPYDQVPAVDLKGQGVFLPYEKFLKLWDAANPKPVEVAANEPPIGAALSGFILTGHVQGEVAELTIEGTVIALAKGWSRIELPGALALGDFKPSDKRLVLERVAAGEGRHAGLVLHLPEAGSYRFTATLSAPIERDAAGKRTLVLALPAAAAGRLDLLIADTEAEVALTPLVAATTIKEKGGTRVLAVLGGAPRLGVTWQPPVQESTGEALVLASGDLRLTVAERSLRYDLAARLTVLRRPLAQLSIALPPDTQVLAVEAKGLRTWEKTSDAKNGDLLVLHLHEAVEGAVAVSLRLERLLPALAPGESRTVTAAWPAISGAARSTGTVAVVQGDGLAVAVERADGLGQVDPAEVPEGQGAIAAFRYLAPPPATVFTVTRLQPELRAAVHQLVRLGVEEDLIAVVLRLEVRKAGVFAVACEVPAAWELVDTTGLAVDDVRPGKPLGATRRYEIALRSRLLGSGELVLRFKAPPSIPREATAGAAPAAIAVAVLQLPEAHQVRGSLAVAAPRSWALSTGERSGLTGAEVETLRREGALAGLARELKEDEDLPLGFTFLGAGAAVRLAAAPRARELSLAVEELVTAAEGHLRRVATLRGEVRYSAAALLRLQAPSALDDKLVFKGANLAEHAAVARADGLTTWELRFQSPVLGAFVIGIEQVVDIPALVAGVPVKLEVAPLRPLDITRLRYLGAVAREGTVEVAASASGLDAVAPADLPPGLQGQGVVAAFQGAAPVVITLTLVRHDLVPLADGAVTGARYAAVLGEDGVLRVRGDLLLTTRGRPYLELRLPAGAELLEVAVDGHQGRPSRRADGGVVVPLGDGHGLRSQRLALVYEQRLDTGKLGSLGSAAMTLPRLGAGNEADGAASRPLPVGLVELALYVPEPLAAYGWSGDLQRSEGGELFAGLLARVGGLDLAGDGNEQALRAENLRLNEQMRVAREELDGRRVSSENGNTADGLTVDVALVGTPHDLRRLGDGGTVTFRYVNHGVLHGLALALVAVGAVAMWLLRRRGELAIALVASAAVLVLAVGGPWLEVAAGFAAGVAVVGAGLLLAGLVRGWRNWRRKPAEIGPDPWLEAGPSHGGRSPQFPLGAVPPVDAVPPEAAAPGTAAPGAGPSDGAEPRP